MPFYLWGSSQPICYGYQRGVLEMPQQGGVEEAFSGPVRGCII